MAPECSHYVSVQGAAEITHHSERTIRDYLRTGKLKGTRIGRKWLVLRSSLPGADLRGEGQAFSEVVVGGHLRVWLGDERFATLRAVSVEDIPASGASMIDFGPIGQEEGLALPAARALGLQPDDLVRFRIEVVDDLEVSLVESPECPQRLGKRRFHHKVDLYTKNVDPQLESTLFWLWGANNRLYITVRNPTKYARQLSRVRLYGQLIVTVVVKDAQGAEVNAVTLGWA